MRRNNIRAVWERGECVVNGWLAIPSAFSAEVMAHCGWDSLCVDIQHGMVDYQTATTMMQAISTTSVTPIVRVPWNDPAIIMKCLDAGAYGIVCPMINSVEDALRFAGACRYPPMGYRSLGPIRAQLYGGSDYAAKANEEIVAFAMIETTPGLENLDSILKVEGLMASTSGLQTFLSPWGCPAASIRWISRWFPPSTLSWRSANPQDADAASTPAPSITRAT